MKLSEYLRSKKIDRQAFAETIGVDRVSVYRWETGKSFPIRHIQKIITATEGKVTANDFMDAA
jgi:DNA-binding transcriptional regulator YiaG